MLAALVCRLVLARYPAIRIAGVPGLLSPAALLDNVGDAFVSAGLSTAVYGGDFGGALGASLKSSAIFQIASIILGPLSIWFVIWQFLYFIGPAYLDVLHAV